MKNTKKKLLILFSSCAFVALMLFNVSVSMEDTGVSSDIGLSGIITQADPGTEDPWGDNCHHGYCYEICGESGPTFCTAMDCGSGTQSCSRN